MKILSTTENFIDPREQTGAWFTVPDDTKRFYDLTFVLDNVGNESTGWLDFDLKTFAIDGPQVFGIHSPNHLTFSPTQVESGQFGLVLPPNYLTAIVQSLRVRISLTISGPSGKGVKISVLGGIETI